MAFTSLPPTSTRFGPSPATARLRRLLRIYQSLAHSSRTESRMRKDLARLAETAPHLLPDIGLPVPDDTPQTPPRHLPGRGV